MRHITRILVLVAMLAALTLGAGAQSSELTIVASFSILADVVQNVVGETATVSSLIPVGADPHSFEPSAREMARLAEADIVFVAGANFEEALLHAIESAAPDAVLVEASACVPMREYGDHADDDHDHDDHADEHEHDDHAAHEHTGAFGLDLEALCSGYAALLSDWDANNGGTPARVANNAASAPLFEADCGGHDHDDEHDHAEEADDHAHDHEHGVCDPHVWSDPHNVALWTLYIRDVLSAADVTNSDVYADNADAYLKALDAKVRLELAPLLAAIPSENRVLLSNHETLGYFAAAYGFDVAGFVLPGGSSLAEPSAQALAALIQTVRDAGVTAIFAENTLASRVAEQVAAESGASFYTLYTDSLSAADGTAATYLDYITYNFTTIAEALTPR